jgi:ABC-2 type transport system permease protein
MRQLTGKWRLAIIILVAAVPVVVVLAFRAAGGADDRSAGDIEDGIRVLLDGMIVAAVLPIVTMTFATASFGNEIEDGTLGYLLLNPMRRWSIVLGKMLAPVTVAAPVLIISGVAVALLGLDGDFRTAAAVAVGLLAGVVGYSVVFSWLGLATGHPLGFALVYVFLWEGLLSSFLGGIRYLSVRAYTLTMMEGIDDGGLDALGELTIELPAAIAGVAAVSAVFFWLAVRRLRRMDVP